MADVLNPLGNVFNSGRNLAPAAVGSQVLLMSALSVCPNTTSILEAIVEIAPVMIFL